MQLIPQAVVSSTYSSAFDSGQLDRQATTPSKSPYRTIGRPALETVCKAPGIRIDWPQSESGRVRNIISRSGLRRRYKVPCFRSGDREAQAEAEEEATLYVLLDACAGVEFQDQPATLTFEWNGTEEEHRPDALAVAGTTKLFIECKDDAEIDSLFLRSRTKVLKERLALAGFLYVMLSMKDLKRGAYYDNAVRMRRRAKMIFEHSEWLRAAKNWPVKRGWAAAREILSNLPQHEQLDALYALLYSGDLVGDLSQPVTLDMHVRPPPIDGGELPWVWDLCGKTS